jgi:hypothetical protein
LLVERGATPSAEWMAFFDDCEGNTVGLSERRSVA